MNANSKYHFVVALMLTACASQNNAFKDIDYSRVYQRAGERENDPAYKLPSTVGCVDDDFNCGKTTY